MTIYISVKKYLPDNPLNLILMGQLLYNSDKKLIGAYAMSTTNLVYTTNAQMYVPEDVYFCFNIHTETQIKDLENWVKDKGYKMKVEII